MKKETEYDLSGIGDLAALAPLKEKEEEAEKEAEKEIKKGADQDQKQEREQEREQGSGQDPKPKKDLLALKPDKEDGEAKEAVPTENNEKDSEEESEKASASEEKGAEAKSDENDDSSSEGSSADHTLNALALLKMAVRLLNGEIAEEEIANLLEADKASEAIEEAYQRGLIEGRNAQIEERLEVLPVGAPDLCGAPPASGRAADSIFDLARMAR